MPPVDLLSIKIKWSRFVLLTIFIAVILLFGYDKFRSGDVAFLVYSLLMTAFILSVYFRNTPMNLTVSGPLLTEKFIIGKTKTMSIASISSITFRLVRRRTGRYYLIYINGADGPLNQQMTISSNAFSKSDITKVVSVLVAGASSAQIDTASRLVAQGNWQDAKG